MEKDNKTLGLEFNRKIYTYHFEEIEFLLGQRLTLLQDPEIEWPDIAEFEDRLQANVEGVIIGGEAADDVAREMLVSDDLDLVRGAAYMLAHSKSPEALTAVCDAMVEAPPELLPAYVEAFKHPPHYRLPERIAAMLMHDRAEILAAAIEILGYRRQGEIERMALKLNHSEPAVAKAAVAAVARMHYVQAMPQMIEILDSSDSNTAIEAALVLAVFQNSRGQDWLRQFCRENRDNYMKAPLYIGLTGTVSDAGLLIGSPAAKTENAMTGLGIIGSVEAVEFLLSMLETDSEELKSAAAGALELITGAGLKQEFTEIEEWDTPDEGVIESEEIKREGISISYEAWSGWWKQNGGRFGAGKRYRFGELFSPEQLVNEIRSRHSRFQRRYLAHRELLSYGEQYFHFEPDWFIARQQEAINKWPQKGSGKMIV